MDFFSTRHQKRYFELVRLIPDELKGKRGLKQLAYVMAGDKEIEAILNPYINWRTGFNYHEVPIDELSSDKLTMVKAAALLQDDENEIQLSLTEVFTKLNMSQRKLILQAAEYKYITEDGYSQHEENLYMK